MVVAVLVVLAAFAGLRSAARPGSELLGGPAMPSAAPAAVTAQSVVPGSDDPPTPGPSPAWPAGTAAVGATLLVAAGDIGRCDATTDNDTGALAAALPGVVATLGDTAYDSGSRDELERCFGESWGGVKDRIRFAVTGNHDVRTDGGAPLRAYLGSAAARDGHTYFSDELGAWHVVVLDADCGTVDGGCGPDSPQVRWLRDDLASHPSACTLALWHQPRFSSGEHGDDAETGAFWDALYAAGADLVLNGHDHDYERFVPQDPSGQADDARGITEIVVGTGGGRLRPFRQPPVTSAARSSDAYGVLQLALRADGWSYRFVDTAGAVRDEGTGSCH